MPTHSLEVTDSQFVYVFTAHATLNLQPTYLLEATDSQSAHAFTAHPIDSRSQLHDVSTKGQPYRRVSDYNKALAGDQDGGLVAICIGQQLLSGA
jgi:hypothetical protein